MGSSADAHVIGDILAGFNAEGIYCDGPEDLCVRVLEGPGAIIVTDEVLTEQLVADLVDTIQAPPELANIPVMLVAAEAPDSRLAIATMERLENVLLLSRPVHLRTFESALRMVLKARARQLQLHDVLEEQRQSVDHLKRLTDDLTRSNEDLERFSYFASHDLQEPLRQISGFVQLLEKRHKDNFDQEAREYFDYIIEASQRMSLLIRDLLHFSRLGKGADISGEVDLGHMVDIAVRNVQRHVEKSGASIHIGKLPTVRGNSTLLVQVFQNLVGNAIKFKKEEPPIVDIGAKKQDSEWLLWVQDNGIGFEPENAQRIFQVFQRLHERSRYSGSGIGLAICKRAIELHGGRIWAESEPGKGATFYFALPAREQE
ncbi:MAG: ATP-binding protein [Candidatus Hydrogenedentes bacterium]|nr:ATP-binding protein [Candidatus Hydrogenedentota bacterium]